MSLTCGLLWQRWINNGFPELGDFAGMGLGATTAQVVFNEIFLRDPHAAAEAAWIKLNRNAAPNGARTNQHFPYRLAPNPNNHHNR
mgnify:CR=1 FL=1